MMRGKHIGLTGWVLRPLALTVKRTYKALAPSWAGGEGVATRPYPYEGAEERERLRRNFRGQHVIDWEKCIGCSLCARVCPNQCITMEFVDIKPEEYKLDSSRAPIDEIHKGVKRPGVDTGHCLYCGNCAEYCPPGAWTFSEFVEIADFTREDLYYSAEELREKKQAEEPTKFLVNLIEEHPILTVDDCIGCFRCERECPTRCISMIDGPNDRKGKPVPIPEFDYSLCIGCDSCVEVCPALCLKMEDVTGGM